MPTKSINALIREENNSNSNQKSNELIDKMSEVQEEDILDKEDDLFPFDDLSFDNPDDEVKYYDNELRSILDDNL